MPPTTRVTWCWSCRIIQAETCLVCLHACCQECIDDACGCPQCGTEDGEECPGCLCPCIEEEFEANDSGEYQGV